MHGPARVAVTAATGVLLAAMCAGAAAGLTLAWAGPVLAETVASCVCAAPDPSVPQYPVAVDGDADSYAVLVGVAGPVVDARVSVKVELWFHGPGAARRIDLAGSRWKPGTLDTCIVEPAAGQRYILTLFWLPEAARWAQGSCSPYGELGTELGRTLLGQARAAYGSGRPASALPATTADNRSPGDRSGSARTLALLSLVFGASLVVSFAAAGRRSRQPASRQKVTAL
jgi:hypothetical protein